MVVFLKAEPNSAVWRTLPALPALLVSHSLRLIFWGYKGSVWWEAGVPRLLRRRVTLPHSWSQLKTDCSASGIITDNTNLDTAQARPGRQTEMQILIFHGLGPLLTSHTSSYMVGLKKIDFYKLVFPPKGLYYLEDYLNDSVNSIEQCSPSLHLPLISIDISPACFSSKSTLISLINRPHYGQDCQKYFYLPRNILYCVNISLCLYFLWLSITATTNVSSAYKSIVLPLIK